MINEKKKWLGFVFLFVISISGWVMKTLKEPDRNEKKVIAINGHAQGTSYHIKYRDKEGRNLRHEIDSIFLEFDQAFSAWLPDSEINTLNREEGLKYPSPYFFPVLEKSLEVYEKTGGAFDPTIAPLVKAWGFGPEGIQEIPSDQVIDSLKQLVGFRSIRFDKQRIQKFHKNVQLDFNAIAPGYTVDVLASFFKSKGIQDFFIEIGGEVYAMGVNEQGDAWRVGINTPSELEQEQMDIQLILQLKDRAVTTSGNYRRFYEKDGMKYSHTISPITGRPVRHALLSATVLAPDCMTADADAYATAFMVLGLDKSIEMVKKHQDLAVILIYSSPNGGMNTYVSPEISHFLLKNEIAEK